MTPDLIARRIIMASHLYYDHAQPIYSDAQYDRLCRYVSRNFDKLHPTRVWQLRNRRLITTSGFHIKLTTQSIQASHRWYYEKFGRWPDFSKYCLSKPRKHSPTNGDYYAIGG